MESGKGSRNLIFAQRVFCSDLPARSASSRRARLLLRDNLLHDLVENYVEITPKLHAKNATQAAHKIGRGASRRSQFWASGVSPFLRAILAQFRRNVQPNRAIICQSTEHTAPFFNFSGFFSGKVLEKKPGKLKKGAWRR